MDRLPISLAEWALVEEIRAGTLSTLGFPRVARQDFDLDAVELVNTLFGVPTLRYLAELKSNAESEGTRILLIMVDDEGDGCSQGKKDREQFWIHHRKWVDIAQFLGCQAIRTNCRGPENASPSEALEWAADSYHPLLAYAEQANIRVLVENHGGFSDYADWMLALIKKIDHPGFGSYPDWREPGLPYNNFEYLIKMLPHAGGMSYRNQPSDASTVEMIRYCRQAGYKGWYGIESGGREAIRKAIGILSRCLGVRENIPTSVS